MDDLINRTAAIVELDKYAATLNPDKDNKELWKVNSIKQFIKQFPSAQPVDKDIDVLSTDTINRQAAIDALTKYPHYYDGKDCVEQNWDDVKTITNLPSAQPQKMREKWDFIGNNQFRCTGCKHIFMADWLEDWRTYTYEQIFPKFCPSCGSDMREVDT